MSFSGFQKQCSLTLKWLQKTKEQIQVLLEEPFLKLDPGKCALLNEYEKEVHAKQLQFENSLAHLFSIDPDTFSGYDEDKVLDIQVCITNCCIEMKALLRPYTSSLTNLTSRQSNSEQDVSLSNSHGNTALKLPPLVLKTFNGSPEQWLSFYSLFEASVHKNTCISNIEKLQYLISSLQAEPLNLVKNLPITQENYAVAWNILTQRYQNNRKIVAYYVNNLIDIPNVPTPNTKNLRSFISKYHENVQALAALKYDVKEDNIVLSTLLLRKLDVETRKKFEDSRQDSQNIPSVDEIVTFLEKECLHIEAATFNQTYFHSKVSGNSYTSLNSNSTKPIVTFNSNKWDTLQTKRFVPVLYSTVKSNSCSFCHKEDHSIYRCTEFKALDVSKRFNFVKENKFCFNCLGTSHTQKYCKSKGSCSYCEKRHHSLMHFPSNNQPDHSIPSMVQTTLHDVENASVPSTSKSKQTPLVAFSQNKSNIRISKEEIEPNSYSRTSLSSPLVAMSATSNKTILLGTALVHLTSSSGNSVVARAVIDSASMTTCITEKIASLLCLKRSFSSLYQVDGLSSTQVKTKGIAEVNVAALNGKVISDKHTVVILEKITSDLPHLEVPANIKDSFHNLVLADPTFHKPSAIDMLLGADLFSKVMTGERLLIHQDLPAAMNSIFGYVIIGPASVHKLRSSPSNKGIVSLLSTQDIDLHQSLQRFWAVDEPPHKKLISPEEEECEKQFCDTHYRDSQGRYVVRLPLKENHTSLGDSSTCAKKRFFSQENMFLRKPDLKIKYSEAMNDSISAGHMKLMNDISHLPSENFFLPHHAVVKEESSTTKLRVVFDASAHSSTGVSLNQVLHTGPKLHNDLCDVLLQFRYYPVVFSCDIKQMFKGILVHPDDRKYQLLYWRENSSQPLAVYCFTTVVFGMSCSPYLAIRTLKQLIEDEGHNYPLASQALKKQVYVDDLVLGSNSLQEGLRLQNEVIQLLAKGGFELRKWTSNCKELIDAIPDSHRENPRFQDSDQPHFNILGMKWCHESDSFSYQTNLPIEATWTKRKVLGTICKIFDPCGWITPITLWAKSLIQALWVSNVQWDETIPDELKDKWKNFLSQISLLSELHLARCIPLTNAQDIQLHGFSDGSESGYGATVYLRIVNSQGHVSTHLLLAKARVSPLKRISVPRLELCGAHLLTKLLHHCHNLLTEHYSVSLIKAWSDSTIVLSWINTLPFRLKVYVANRVAEIQDLIPSHVWSHVPTHLNPADLASRGLLPVHIIHNDLWWKGPHWMSLGESSWPCSSFNVLKEDSLPELKPNSLPILVATEEPEILLKFSSYSKLQRVMCYILRFINGLRGKNKETGSITTVELNQATNQICKVVQNHYFHKDIKLIKSGKPASKKIQRLSPFIDEEGIIRVGGRIQKSNLPYSAKHPILLGKCHVTNVIIDYYHKKYLHAGPQFLQATISQKFWILSARNNIRQRVFKCIPCFRCRPKIASQKMGDLPASRLYPQRPFYNCGTDFAGPFLVKPYALRKVTVVKVYLCIFICFSSKAVHIEVVTSLTADAYIAALSRFVSRRGLCANIYSDCGTNYTGAHSAIQNLWRKFLRQDDVTAQLITFTSENETKFHFNPPAAPHQGGLWERGVKSVKHHLQRVVGSQTLTLEEFMTLSVRIESILNSRPITPLSADPTEIDCLTPGHFIAGGPLIALPEPNWDNVPTNHLSRWQLVQALVQSFWKRWERDYIHTLQQKSKWTKVEKNIQIGDLVIVDEPDLPPFAWKLGRVTATFPGQDGMVRVVEVKTKKGLFKRPITKLAVLPLD